MTTDTQTLTSFLLARIADDEAVARDAAGWDRDGRTRANGRWSRTGIASLEDDQRRSVIYSDADQLTGVVAAHIARHDPARVLAECAAKRAQIEHLIRFMEGDYAPWNEEQLQIMASVYSDHPEFRADWA